MTHGKPDPLLDVTDEMMLTGNVAVALGAFRRTQGATEEVVIVEDAESVPIGGSARFLYSKRLEPALLIRLDQETYVAYPNGVHASGLRGAAPAHTDQAWLLVGFSLLSFAIVLALVMLEPAPRSGRGRAGRR